MRAKLITNQKTFSSLTWVKTCLTGTIHSFNSNKKSLTRSLWNMEHGKQVFYWTNLFWESELQTSKKNSNESFNCTRAPDQPRATPSLPLLTDRTRERNTYQSYKWTKQTFVQTKHNVIKLTMLDTMQKDFEVFSLPMKLKVGKWTLKTYIIKIKIFFTGHVPM